MNLPPSVPGAATSPATTDRRRWLNQMGCGFAALATECLLAGTAIAQPGSSAAPEFHRTATGSSANKPISSDLGTHHRPAAKRIIFLFMQGGVSQVDTFDHKPLINQRAGEVLTFDDARQLAKIGQATPQRLLPTPWKFQQYGESGRWVSELFPHQTRTVDRACFLHAVHTEGVAHGPATLFLHCGATQFVRPSFGAWVLYGLGPDNQNLPGFVSIAPSLGNGGPRNYGSAFLPAHLQGTPLGLAGSDQLLLPNLHSSRTVTREQAGQALLRDLNAAQWPSHQETDALTDELAAATKSLELAWNMQTVAPEILDFSNETEATLQAYGIDQPATRSYGRRCLLARRLCEAGVRFIQVNYGDNSANPAWDQHSNLPKHADHALATDQPVAALLDDLAQRGLLEDTIVWWGSEFGRTPYSENNGTGRDHNPNGFTMWLAGGGFRPGFAFGQTDEFGFRGIEGRVHLHDLHATLLHQLGLDHTRLTYQHAGRDFRLTDVHGRVVTDILTSG